MINGMFAYPKRGYLMKTMRRVLIVILLSIALPTLCLDLMLWHIDPLGTRAMVYDWIALAEVDMPHVTGYQYPEGTYNLTHHTVTMIDDGKRLVPASGNGDCVIAFVGDSVTWGAGVNDADTFVNQLALLFPQVTIWNTGRNRYSVTNVNAAIDHYQADGYVWTMISNDAGGLALPQTYTRNPSAFELYMTTLAAEYRNAQNLSSLTWGDYATLAQDIVNRDNVLTFGFQDDPLAMEAEAWGVHLIPYPTETVSAADKHPSARGHERIALDMLPFVAAFVTRICNEPYR
jgi:hypothetical protein